jgi:hypothetical protein
MARRCHPNDDKPPLAATNRKEHFMDETRFDTLARSLSGLPTRRAAVRLLAGSLVAGLLAWHGAAPARTLQRPDSDGDGLYDDDEVEVYGTKPDVADTDGDGTGDGEEIYNRDNGLGGPSDPLTPDGGNMGCPEGQATCGGVCIDVSADPANCGACGSVCAASENCYGGVCLAPAPSSDQVCAAQGLSACGGVCTNTLNDNANCGVCGNSCPLGGYCEGGACVGGCPGTICGGVCVDTSSDGNNCGACGNVCNMALTCCNGGCVDLNTDVNNCGLCSAHCFIPMIGDPTCEGGVCNP